MKIKRDMFKNVREVEISTNELKELATDIIVQVGFLKVVGKIPIINYPLSKKDENN